MHFSVFFANIMLDEFVLNYEQFPAIQNESDTKATRVKNIPITLQI